RPGNDLRLGGLPAADADQPAGHRRADTVGGAGLSCLINKGATAMYKGLLKGTWSQLRTLGIIFMHGFRKRETVNYAEEEVYLSPRYRGRIVLTRDPDGEERCVACNLCAVACPVACIALQKGEREDGRWYPEFFRINFSR